MILMDRLIGLLEDLRPDVDFANADRLVSGGILSSLDLITLLDLIEVEFNIAIKPKDLTAENFNSAKAIWDLINSQ